MGERQRAARTILRGMREISKHLESAREEWDAAWETYGNTARRYLDQESRYRLGATITRVEAAIQEMATIVEEREAGGDG